MCPADFRREGECMFLATECNLFLRPWSDDGLCGPVKPAPPIEEEALLAGLFGALEPGELDGVERGDVNSDGLGCK